MAKHHQYKFCFGPWNISEGQDPYGPTTRPAQTFDWKLEQLKKLGYDAMMFHDDDAVPDIDSKSDAQLRKEAKELKKKLDDAGVAAEMVAPRLWFSPMTIDGAYTSNDPKCRQYAIERSLRCIDIAKLPRHRPDRPLARPRRHLHPRIQERPPLRRTVWSRPSTRCWRTTKRSASPSSPSPTSRWITPTSRPSATPSPSPN